MSQEQAQLKFLHKYLENKWAFNVKHYGRFNGQFDIVRFRNALRNGCGGIKAFGLLTA